MNLSTKGKELLKNLLRCTLLIAFLVGQSGISYSQVDDEFWFVVPELSHRGNTGGTPGTLRIATLELPATVTISMPANPYHPTLNPGGFQDIVIDIAANSTAAVDLTHLIDVAANPANNRLENKSLTPSGINNFGLHITATNMITVYWEVNYDYGADLWTLKGRNALGTLFYTPFQTFYNNRNLIPRTYSAIDIVATTDNTQVTITLPPGKAASYGSLSAGIPAGGTYTVTLNRGQTFSLYPFNYSILAGDRLAGTRVESNEPIAITVKDDAIAAGSQGQDVVGDQIVPVDIIGNTYIVPEINNPNHVYVLATENNTSIYVYDALGVPIGPTPYTTLQRGQQALVVVPNGAKFARITSSLNPADPVKPFYAFQMGIENQSRGGAIIPAIGCTGNTQLAFTRARADNKFYFYIIVKKGNQDKFLIDGVRNDGIIDPGAFTEIQGSGGYMAWFSNSINSNTLSVGQHLVENTGDIFHLGILNGFPGAAQGRLYYGYYSDFGSLNVGASVAGTNSTVVRACYGSPVQLYAYGGTNYLWTPDTYLDDAASNLPTAIGLPPGPHNYTVQVSGACASGTIDITILVSTPITGFFESDVSSACSPVEVTFTDQSTGVWSWQYDMGDGSPLIRYDLDPVTPYPPPPNYPQPFSFTHLYTNTTSAPIERTVTLLVKNESGCADIFTKTIVIYPEIYSAFTVDGADTGCDPLHVQFVNTSSGNTDTWFWEFGDGGSSIEENPEHTFRNLFGPDALTFETRLIAISPYYCRDTSTYTITVLPYIEANFAFDTVAACTPHEIVISDQSFGADTYFWDFGDGTFSSSPGPKIYKTFVNTSDIPVTYTIRLRVENEEGCFDEISRDVTVYPEIIASFTANPLEGCSPFTVVFQNNSSGAAYHFWDFGDGGTSTEVNPVHLYERNLTGQDVLYTVTLIVTSDEYCTDTMRTDILVHPYIEAAFAVNDIVGCDPFTIAIQNQSAGADYYTWDFGDGSPLSYTDAPEFQHTYYNPGGAAVIYPLQLIVRNEEGCADTLTRYITVHPVITANFMPSAFEGCHPLTVTFTDLSLNAVTYFWEFGDGASSTEPSPVHTFTNFGTSDTTYVVTLTTSTADGECVKSISWPILVHGSVLAGFTIDRSSGCNPLEVTLVNTSYGGSAYTWDFGDGTVINTTDAAPFAYTFTNSDFTNPGVFEVVLTVQNDAGCTSEARRNITVLPDIRALFDASSTEGCHPLSVDFTNLSDGSQNFLWDFGDGTSSNLRDPSHIFSNTGTSDSTYTVTLVAESPDNQCVDSFSISITVHPYIKAEFTFEENYRCSPFRLQLNNSSVGGNIFHWDFGDGTDTITTNLNPIFHTFNNSGFDDIAEFMVTLTATSSEGCSDAITRPVMVYPDILADFSMSIDEGCHPLEVQFNNLTSNGFYYTWDFGDGSSSSSLSPVHTFTNFTDAPITRQVQLTAISKYFCVSGITREVTIHPQPKALFETDRVVDCPPFDVVISNTSLNADHYRWNFGDGTTSDTDSPLPLNHLYDNFTGDIVTYSIRLTATSDFGCIDSAVHNINVYPRTIAAFSSNDEGCSPLAVYFVNESILGQSFSWELGDGMNTSVKDPTHTYFNFTSDVVLYPVRLTSVSRYGCTDTASGTITVHPQPKAEFIPLPTHQTYPSATVSVANITNPGPWSFLWDMDDGSTTTLENPPPYTYSGPGEYDIMLYVSSTRCYDSVSHKIRIFPGPPVAAFDTVLAACEPYTVQFTNRSLYGDSYLWDFDDGTTSTEFEPVHTFAHYGVYNVKLTVTGTGGRDYAYRQVEVYRKPVVSFRVAPDLVMLPDDEIQLYNMSQYGVQYLWDFGDGSISNEVNPRYLYSTLGTFDISLQVWTENGCTDLLVKPSAVTVEGRGWIKFPNAFRPDMSGSNGGAYSLSGPEMDYVFHPFWEGVETYHLQIFNRWGVLIYTSYDVMKGWDGYYNGSLCQQGVYVWKCTGTFANGKTFELVGDVTLLLHRR